MEENNKENTTETEKDTKQKDSTEPKTIEIDLDQLIAESIKEQERRLKELRTSQRDFPIIRPKTEELLKKIVIARQPNMILELGTCRGYSGIVMLSACPKSSLLTVERDKENYNEAIRNFIEFDMFERTLPINGDAVEVVEKLYGSAEKPKFDLIFLDCNKSSYVKVLPLISELLSDGGVLVADNVLYFGKVMDGKEIPDKKHRTAVVNLRKFISEVQNSPDFTNTTIYEIEDGVLVTTKK